MAGNDTKQTLINHRSPDFSNDALMAADTNENHLLIIEDDQGRKVIDSSELSPALLNLIVELASQLKNKKDK